MEKKLRNTPGMRGPAYMNVCCAKSLHVKPISCKVHPSRRDKVPWLKTRTMKSQRSNLPSTNCTLLGNFLHHFLFHFSHLEYKRIKCNYLCKYTINISYQSTRNAKETKTMQHLVRIKDGRGYSWLIPQFLTSQRHNSKPSIASPTVPSAKA